MKRFKNVAAASGALISLLLFTLVFGLALSSSAWASSTVESHGFTTEMWKNFGYRVANFVLFGGIIIYFVGGKAKSFFKSRSNSIAKDLKELEAAKAIAAANLADVEKRIAGLEQERVKIMQDYEAQGEALKASIIAKAEKMARQIIEQAEHNAHNEFKMAIDGLRAEMANLITQSVEELIQKQLNPAEHEKLIDKYLTKVVLH